GRIENLNRDIESQTPSFHMQATELVRERKIILDQRRSELAQHMQSLGIIPKGKPTLAEAVNVDAMQGASSLSDASSTTSVNQQASSATPPSDEKASHPVRDQVFISYSHKDQRWLDKFETAL